LAEAIREYLPGLLGLLRGFESLDKRIGARYSMAVVLAKLIVGFALRAESNRDAEERIFNGEGSIQYICDLAEEAPKACLPYWETCLDALSKLGSIRIAELKAALALSLMGCPAILAMRGPGEWLAAIDGTQQRSYGAKRHCPHCQTRVHGKGTDKEWTEHFHTVSECKLIIGPLAISLFSIRLRGSDGSGKQECGLAALEKMLACLNFYYPGKKFLIAMDALYVARSAVDEIGRYGYKYIIRYKDTAAATIDREFRNSKESARFGLDLPKTGGLLDAAPVLGFANGISFASKEEEAALGRLSLKERKAQRRRVNICEYIEAEALESGEIAYKQYALCGGLQEEPTYLAL
jgi:hypothetical protein